MILILSADDDKHVPSVVRRLQSLGAEYFWFDPARFPSESDVSVSYDRCGLLRAVLHDRGRTVDFADVSAVWHRRPGVPGHTAEPHGEEHAAVASEESATCLAGVWANMDCLWLPGKPRHIAAAQNKVRVLALAASHGFSIPRTLVTNRPQAVLDFYEECEGQLISKVLLQGVSHRNGDRYTAFTHVLRRRDLAAYRAIRHAPVIVQEYVPKQVECRITVVGSRVFAAEIDSQASRCTKHDWRHYDNDRAVYAPHDLPAEIQDLCVRLVQALELTFGAIDMVLTPAGDYVFLEINPSGQWSWIERLTALPVSAAIAELLVETAEPTARERSNEHRLNV